MERAAAQAASKEIVALHSLRIAHLGEAYLLTGQIEKAMTAATRAAELVQDHDERDVRPGPSDFSARSLRST